MRKTDTGPQVSTAPASEYRTDNGQYDPANREGRFIGGYAPPAPVVNNITVSTPLAPRRTAHAFHLIATCLTGGIWAIVWVVRTVSNRRFNRRHGLA